MTDEHINSQQEDSEPGILKQASSVQSNAHETPRGLRKKLKREQRQQERLQGERVRNRKQKTKKFLWFVLLATVISVLWWWLQSAPKASPDEAATSDLRSCIQHTNVGMHIHPQLVITIKGEQQTLPVNIGITPSCMRPVHTHDDSGKIHLEFQQQRDVKLGEFFEVWDKQFSSSCIFEHCNGSEGTVRMRVNGEETTQFESYIMHDGDHIEIIYE